MSRPDFLEPPISEVALSVQFEALRSFKAVLLSPLWSAFGGKDDFPTIEEQPPLPQVREKATPARIESPKLEILNVPPLPRSLYISKTGNWILQVQPDRFGLNWKKSLSSQPYPRFEVVLAQFERYYAIFAEFAGAEGLGQIRINQAEVTYVNKIKTEPRPGVLRQVISVLSGEYSDNFLRDPEDFKLSLRYPLLREQNFAGRLYIDARPGTLSETHGNLDLTLLARGKPSRNDIEGAREFFEMARAYIVSAFTSITSEQMHKDWRRTDNA